jgi:outer membrane PBP1 activator LpoA protein
VLHRWLVVPLAAAVLYGCAPALASEAAVTYPAIPPPALAEPVPLSPSGERAARVRPVPPSGGPQQIALLLPLESKSFGRHADAVRLGFLAAAKAQGGGPPVRVHGTGDDPEQSVNAYINAVNAGARVVVGPLTRDSVAAVMGSAAVLVPTLALNVPDGLAAPLLDMYTFSLQIDAEARQVAQLAWQDGYRSAVTVSADSTLSRRILQGFVEEFTRLGGTHVGDQAFTSNPESLARMRKTLSAGADMAFLALDFSRARQVRPYLGNQAIYATSQVYPGNAGPLTAFDLAGVRFLDMPWVLQQESPELAAYPRPGLAVELERFYALGIDAYRLALMLLAGKAEAGLDGATGRLMLGSDRQFARRLLAAQFSDGKLVVRERP